MLYVQHSPCRGTLREKRAKMPGANQHASLPLNRFVKLATQSCILCLGRGTLSVMIFLCYASLKVCGLEITPENSNMGHVAHGTSNPANAENLACHGSRKLDEEYFTWAWFAFMHFKHQESSHACGVYAANSSPGAQNQSKGRDVPCDDSKQMRRQRMVQCRKERRRKRSFANLFWACARGPSKNMPHLFAIVAAHVRIGAYLSSYSNV